MKSAGYTLVELMIVITISVLLMIGGAVRYVDFNRTQIIKNAGQTIKTNLRDAQAAAMSGNRPTSGCVISNPLLAYQVSIPTTTTYRVDALCESGPSGTAVTYTLPLNLQFHTPLPATFQFNILAQGVTPSSRVISIRTLGSVAASTKWYRICVKLSGNIDDSYTNNCGYAVGMSPPNCSCT